MTGRQSGARRFGYLTGEIELDAELVPGHRWECYMVFGSDAHTAAVCECGWNGPKRQLLGLAEDDGEQHAKAATNVV